MSRVASQARLTPPGQRAGLLQYAHGLWPVLDHDLDHRYRSVATLWAQPSLHGPAHSISAWDEQERKSPAAPQVVVLEHWRHGVAPEKDHVEPLVHGTAHTVFDVVVQALDDGGAGKGGSGAE